jgi:hypothetical protein
MHRRQTSLACHDNLQITGTAASERVMAKGKLPNGIATNGVTNKTLAHIPKTKLCDGQHAPMTRRPSSLRASSSTLPATEGS